MAITRTKKGHLFWLHQRLTAILFVLGLGGVLVTTFLSGVATLDGFIAWMRNPLGATFLTLVMLSLYYHSFLGLKMIIEDYVHKLILRASLLFFVGFIHIVAALLAVIFIIKM